MKDFWNKIESQSFKNMEGERMKCSYIRNMISPYVDDELTPVELKVFASHLADCPGCKKELEEIRSVRRLFASAERFEAPCGFATRVTARLEETEETRLSRLWRFFTGRPFFLRTVEVAFALVIFLVGMISGNLLVADRTSGRQTTVQEAFSLDLFQATPPGSMVSIYMRLAGDSDER
jgi:anti-sigma factor RsiW